MSPGAGSVEVEGLAVRWSARGEVRPALDSLDLSVEDVISSIGSIERVRFRLGRAPAPLHWARPRTASTAASA